MKSVSWEAGSVAARAQVGGRTTDLDLVAVRTGKSKGTMKQVEYWRWRYRDPQTGRICRTMFQLTAEEAAKYPEAERIPGSMLLREVEDSAFVDARPRIFRPAGAK